MLTLARSRAARRIAPAAALLALCASLAPGAAPAAAATTVTLHPSLECVYIRLTSKANSSTCEGPMLVADNTGGAIKRPLLEFDVEGAVPPTATVLRARLAMKGGQDWGAVTAHVVTRAWTVDANWYRADATQSWAQPGGDFDSAVAATDSFNPADGWTSFVVTTTVRDWAARRRPNHGLLFNSSVGDTFQWTSSKNLTEKPYLEITYE